jgi:iron complex transport system substrate-binding protein
LSTNGLIALLLTVSASMIAADAGAEHAVTVTDGLGRTVSVGRVPQRIISTVPSNTEMLYDLGLKEKVVAVTAHCAKTCDIGKKAVIGGWSEPAIINSIAALKPDLVVAFGGLQEPLAAELDRRHIPVFVFHPETVEQTLAQILSVGRLTGAARTAEAIVAACRANLKRTEEKYRDIPVTRRLKCLRLMSTEAMVVGGTSFQSDIIKRAGGVNVFEDIRDAYPVVSFKEILARDPDMIIFNRDNEGEAVAWFLGQAGWNELRAAREKRLMSISCDYICHPNTRIDKTVEMLARRFYPERFGGK